MTKYKLGELIELVEETNSEGMYGPEDVSMQILPKRYLINAMYSLFVRAKIQILYLLVMRFNIQNV